MAAIVERDDGDRYSTYRKRPDGTITEEIGVKVDGQDKGIYGTIVLDPTEAAQVEGAGLEWEKIED